MTIDKFDDYNDSCPFCGLKKLEAQVKTFDINVPLHEDGYNTLDGDSPESEIIYIECVNCGKEVRVDHYFCHSPDGDECDCNEKVE